MVKNIAFMPLRGGSKSIPLKNIKMLLNKPLCYWSLLALQQSVVDFIYVATDSNEISSVVQSFNFDKVVIYNRATENAQDTSTTESVMLEFLNINNTFNKEDIFILAQATSPFIKAKHINEALELLKNTQADSILSATLTKRFFWNYNDVNSSPINYDYKNRPRRQDFVGSYLENGAFYINKINNIIKNKNRLSGKISIYEMPEYTSLELDEEIDWIIAEQLMKEYNLI